MRTIEELKEKFATVLWNIEPYGTGKAGKVDLSKVYCGYVKLPDCGTCTVVFGYKEGGYEHVSIAPKHKNRIPSWIDMNKLKSIFFTDEEEAYQIMPKVAEYVNLHDNCLHLWRPANGKELKDLVKE